MANPRKPVGVLVHNPNPATSQAESEKTVTPSAAVPSGTGAAPTTNASSGPAPVSVAVNAYQSSAEAAMVALKPSLLDLPPNLSAHHASVGATGEKVIELVSAMLRANPTLSGSFTADDLDAVVADADACSHTSAYLGTVIGEVATTGRLRLETASQMSTEVLAVARKRALRNATLATSVADIDAVRALGPKADRSEKVALTKQQKATKANARAATADQQAATAASRANALQHGTGDATVTQPAPPAPAPSTTSPSASALAATPGTPGSTTIR